jgi:hypothetical protein
MATRMQQRRGTAAQWISTNAGAGPVLNAGEIGWESDTNKFKIGDGVNNWTSLDYFADVDSTVNPAFGTSITFEGATADSYETILQVTDPTADRTITLPNVTGTVITTGNLSDITNIGVFTSTITMEGSSADDFELTLSAGNPTADRTITFPDATGTVALTTDIAAGTVTETGTQTLTNKSISLGSNTVTSTLAQLNTAVSDADVASLAGSETLTNKTLTSPVINTPTGITKTDVGLANVDNTTDANKPVSTATQTALDLKANLSGPTFTGTISAASLTLSGDLTVNGTTTNINSTNLVVEDKNIVLADVETPTDTTADGGGITLKGATDKTFNWVDATDSWTSSEHINIASGKSYYVNGTLLKDVSETLTNKTLTTPVISSISNTGTLTLPTSTDTLVGRATTDTLTNKSISLTTNTITGTIAEFNSAVTDQDLATLAGTETLTNKTLGSAVATTALTLNATAELRLADTDSTHYVGFKAPGTVSANKIWTLPAADGAAGQVLTTDGSGVFSFSTPAAGAAFSELMLIGA